jgi:hypothetical protein
MRRLTVLAIGLIAGCGGPPAPSDAGIDLEVVNPIDMVRPTVDMAISTDLAIGANSDIALSNDLGSIADLVVVPDLISTADLAPAADLAMATCTDGVKNGQETDIDCGGPLCPKCVNGKMCVQASDCASGSCSAGKLCQPRMLGFSTQPSMTLQNNGITALSSVDINVDGKQDLITVHQNANAATILLGNGAGGLAQSASIRTPNVPTAPPVAGDFNRDGILDLIMSGANDPSPFTIAIGKGAGTFVASTNFTMVGPCVGGMATADFNGDGLLDLAAADCRLAAMVLLGTGTGTFQAPAAYVAGSNPGAVALADLNGDGKLDIAAAANGSNEVRILLGKGDGTFQTPQSGYTTFAGPSAVGVGDFNEDGKLDLVTANFNTNDLSVLIGNGDGTFKAATNYAVATSTARSIALADFDLDGHLDVATNQTGQSAVAVLLGTGTGTLQPARSFSATNQTAYVAAGDYNGDGKMDLAAGSQATVMILLNSSQ